ncbi:MAG: hypothetical protein H0X66_13610 [Verrucomicrobia bacterium]|nr:hypothetical protein [Verrucomicrobiota bacterium]
MINFSHRKSYKASLIALMIVLLFSVSRVQQVLNHDREKLGLTKLPPLENAPPLLAFTTVALGGFRGLIANALWIRASELQEDDKFFEMVQLSDWITKLEPRFVQVWMMQAWNMAYNISVKFNSAEDRWRWVERGIELLRDEALRYNPDETLIYRELSWFFQHKMGQNLDDAHLYYKNQWFNEMTAVLGKKPNYEALLDPQTEEEKQSIKLLREKYKMDPQIMKEIDERYGPLEWRLPDAHAIYWADVGRRRGKKEDQERLQRSIYQTMQQSFRRGAVYESIAGGFTFGPNLDSIANVNASYEELIKGEDPKHQDQPISGHKNFLKDAVYFLYMYNRQVEAQKWFQYLKEQYPAGIPEYVAAQIAKQPELNFSTNPSLDEYAVLRVTEDVGETDVDRITALVQALLENSFTSLVQDEDDRAVNYSNMARQVHARFQKETEGAHQRVGLPPLATFRERVLQKLLDPEIGLPPEAAARLRTKLGPSEQETTQAAP